jgi:cytochrome o ubiquinol oxidase operon protein cyoD
MLHLDHLWNKSARPLGWGLLLSLLCLFTAYWLSTEAVLSGRMLGACLSGLALIQLGIHVLLFFQIGVRRESHWSIIFSLFTLFVLVVIVGGSLWIMANLGYNTMPPMQH